METTHKPTELQTGAGWLQRWVSRPGARLRLLCLPHAGGAAATYRSWAGGLSEDVELLAVELPGHGTRYGEPYCSSVEEVVYGLLDAVAPLLGRPLAVYGHSMGAMLALELSRGIRRRTGRAPAALLVSSRDAPTPASGGKPAGPDDADDDYLRAALRSLGGTHERALDDEELMAMFLPVLRADVALVASYRYRDERPLRCPVRAYAGMSDETVSMPGLLAWRQQNPDDFRLSRLPGGHFLAPAYEPLHLARITADLAEIRTAASEVNR